MGDKNLRERIINKAYEMFVLRGVKSVTMDAISSELSISKRTLYEEFSSKLELLESVLLDINRYYQVRNEKICKMDVGAIEKIFMIASIDNERTSKETRFFLDIVSNYSDLLDKLIQATFEINVNRVLKNIEQGCNEGHFYKELDFNLAINFFFDLKARSNFKREIIEEDIKRHHMCSIVFFLRSISTLEGLKEIDRLCKINNINIYKKQV